MKAIHSILVLFLAMIGLAGCLGTSERVATSIQAPKSPQLLKMEQQRLLVRSLLYRHAVYLTPSCIERLSGRIVQWSDAAGFDPLFVLAVIKVESGFQPRAVSYAGASGLMQMLPYVADAEARRLGYRNAADIHPNGLWNPEVNIRLGIHYLGRLRKRFGEDELFLAAYNMGPTLLDARLRHGVRPKGVYSRLVRKAYVQMLGARAEFERMKTRRAPAALEAQLHLGGQIPARSIVLR